MAVVINLSVSAFGDVAQDANTGKNISNGVNGIRDSVRAYFYPLSGVVAGIEDGLVKISLDKENGNTVALIRNNDERKLTRGMRFSVFREGMPFYHPATKEPIGKTEDFVGRIELKDEEARDGLYLCTIIKGDIKPGDIVRITSSRIKLAFFPDRTSDWRLSEAFYESLKDSGRFDMLDSYTTTYEPAELAQRAKELGAEALLIFSTPSKGEKRFLSVRLYWAEDASLFADIKKVADHDLIKSLPPEEEFISISLAKRKRVGSYELAGGELIAMGDVDGRSTRELVVSDGNNIRIYSLEEEPQEIWFFRGSPRERHLSIDILDLNNNGRAEIFVTSLIDESGMSSFVIEYDPSEGYKRIQDNMPYFLRVTGKTLLMQKFTSFDIFSGPVHEGEWKDGHYQPGRTLRLPAGLNIYGFTFIDWQNKGRIHLMTFDDDGYLNLYDNGQLIWRSSDTYGRFAVSFKRETHSLFSPVENTEDRFIRGRLISMRTGRGQELIVVKRIPLLSHVPGAGIKGAEVYSLLWDGSIMDEKLILPQISGTVTDYWVEKEKLFLIVRGGLFRFIKKAVSGDFSKGSILYYYNLK